VRRSCLTLSLLFTEVLESYIDELETTIKEQETELKQLKGEDMDEDDDAPPDLEESEPAFPPIYESGEDFDKAADFKQEAADLKSAGDWEGALAKYTEAILCAKPSALLYANRATALLQLHRFKAAERDCGLALQENPDSAKALRIRGKVRKELGQYELALKDLSASQQIDFDEGTVEDLKFLTEKHLEMEKDEAEKRIKEEEKLRKRAEEIKKAKKDAEREARESAARSMPGGMPGGMGGMPGGMPGGMGGMPGGMPGGGGMEGIAQMMMTDPEIIQAMQNPKVQAALQELMAGPGGPAGLMNNPQKLQEVMSDPEVGPVFEKIMSKLGGGMGGMPGAGAAGGMAGAGAADDDDGDEDIPDLDDLPDLE